MSHGGHLSWAEIDIGALRHNYWLLKKRAGSAGIMAVVKANAYGHGAIEVSKAFIEEGVAMLAVAFVREGLELRDAGIRTPILVFAKPSADTIGIQLQSDLDVTISDIEDVALVSSTAKKLSSTARVHLNIDTGMNRLGAQYDKAVETAEKLSEEKELEFAGLYSHLSSSDDIDSDASINQIKDYNEIINILEGKNIEYGLRHLANSGGLLNVPDSIFDMVRLGISLYGHNPNPQQQSEDKLIQVMTLKSTVSMVRTVDEGMSVSYGGSWTAKQKTKIATIPIGYADGINRLLSNDMEVLIGGDRFPVVGMVTMDMIMADVGSANIEKGDEVVIYGSQGNQTISISEIAKRLNTIPYEISCAVSGRIPRIYVNS